MISKASTNKSFKAFAILVVLLVHLLMLAAPQFTLWPEMVVYPYLINNKFLLYKDIINPYPPTLPIFLSSFTKIFGHHVEVFKLFTWLLIFAVDLLIFKFSFVYSKNFPKALASLAVFAFLSVAFGINGLWFDLVQTPFIIISVYFFYLFLKNLQNRNLFISLVAAICAFFIKQQVLWLIIYYLIVLAHTRLFLNKSTLKTVGLTFFILVSASSATFFFLEKAMVLKDFLFWTITFPYTKASQMPGYMLLPNLKQLLLITALFLPLVFLPKKKNLPTNFLTISTFIMVLFAYPRFDYFHLIPTIAIFSILIPYAPKQLISLNSTSKLISSLAIIYLLFFCARSYNQSFGKETRFFDSDIVEASRQLAGSTLTGDLVYFQNSPDQIMVLSKRIPPKPWADEFSWYLETNNLEQKIVNFLKEQNPKFVLYQPYSQGDEYELGSYRPNKIADFIESNYKEKQKISNLWLKTNP